MLDIQIGWLSDNLTSMCNEMYSTDLRCINQHAPMHEKPSTEYVNKRSWHDQICQFLYGIGACQMLVYDYCYEMHDKIVCIRFELSGTSPSLQRQPLNQIFMTKRILMLRFGNNCIKFFMASFLQPGITFEENILIKKIDQICQSR